MPEWADDLLSEMKLRKLITTSNDKGYEFSTMAQMLKNSGLLSEAFLKHAADINAKGSKGI